MPWTDALDQEELKAVLGRRWTERRNLLVHAASIFAARTAMRLARGKDGQAGVILDFGCGVGRVARVFARKGYPVIGTEITEEMLAAARRFPARDRISFLLTDGVSIPLRDESVDVVWASGVLKYGLFPPEAPSRGGTPTAETASPWVPVYGDIAREMFRVLRPGGHVVNSEMWVDTAPDVFIPGFEGAGFTTEKVRVVRRYSGWMEAVCEWRSWHRLPPPLVMTAGHLCAAARSWFDDPHRQVEGFRDYLFVWSKPGR